MEQVELRQLVKTYGAVRALDGVSLTLPVGSLTAVLGPSGCGKTTLMRCLAGFTQPDAGQVLFGGQDVTRLPPQDRGTAMVFQNYALWPHMTVFDNIAYGLKLRGVPAEERRRRVHEALELVQISHLRDIEKRRPGELSGGQQQRVALARALVVRPRVLLLDEPLSNLDAKVRQHLRVEIRRLQKAVGITTLYVTHDQEEALAIADQVVVMQQGRVIQAGTPEEIYRRPRSVFVADFMGVTNVLRAQVEGGALVLAGRRLPLSPPAGAAGASVVFRAAEAQLLDDLAAPAGAVVLPGTVEEVLYLGTAYRHYVRIGSESVMVDAPGPHPAGPVAVAVPAGALQVFAEP